MTWLISERRQRRSNEQFVALRYQLEHSRERAGLEALVLADDAGIVVAASGDTAVCEELGAFAPLMGQTILGLSLPPLLRGGDVTVHRVRVHGQELFLASIGGGVARDAMLTHSRAGVERILSSN